MGGSLSGKGVLFAVAAYVLWGVFPLYWKSLAAIAPFHILGFRILFSLLVVAGILLLRKNTAWIGCFRDRRKGPLLAMAGMVITFNWGLYIWAVNSGHTVETSLGYYINPLVSVALGLLLFKEKLRPLQWAAVGSAALGVLVLTALSGRPPWISLGLGLSFGLYGMLKKTIPLPALETLGAETLAAAPVGLILLGLRFDAPGQASGTWPHLSYLAALPVHTLVLLLFCGALTALPLYCFARGARMLPLSALGFIQFISPTLQFMAGVFVFGETFPARNYAAFACIWSAAALYILSMRKKL
jgi:chloramphenicol-sensitive protein RarD